MRMTASASSGRRRASAATSSRWQNSDCARCGVVAPERGAERARDAGHRAHARREPRARRRPRRSIRWNSSLSAIWSATRRVGAAARLRAGAELVAARPSCRGADARGGARRGVRLEQRADLVEVEQVGGVEGAHDRAAVWARARRGPRARAAAAPRGPACARCRSARPAPRPAGARPAPARPRGSRAAARRRPYGSGWLDHACIQNSPSEMLSSPRRGFCMQNCAATACVRELRGDGRWSAVAALGLCAVGHGRRAGGDAGDGDG